MIDKQMKITLNQLLVYPCRAYEYLYDKYESDEPFNPIKEIIATGGKSYKNLRWLFENCKESRTEENMDIYIQWNNGDYRNLNWALTDCPEFRTQQNLKIYLEWNDSNYKDLRRLLKYCPEYRTKQNLHILESYKKQKGDKIND